MSDIIFSEFLQHIHNSFQQIIYAAEMKQLTKT
jgi:hypothetical protein